MSFCQFILQKQQQNRILKYKTLDSKTLKKKRSGIFHSDPNLLPPVSGRGKMKGDLYTMKNILYDMGHLTEAI